MEPTDISSYENTKDDAMENQAFVQTPRSPMPMIAGILLIIVGLLGLYQWVAILVADPSTIQSVLPAGSPISADQLQSILTTCGLIGCILSVFALLAGVLALRRKARLIVIFGGVLGLFTVGPLFIGSGLSLVALVLVALSKKEFQ